MTGVIDGIVLHWFVFVAASLVFVIWDGLTNTPVSWVQKLAWILVVLYTGPIGLFVYLLACRNPGFDWHTQYTAAPWKQAVNSEMHCVAGDATGIILAAVLVSFFDLPNGVDIIIEYVAAFLVGLLVFQALMMKSMYNNDYWLAVRKTFFAETVSMNMVMVGMIPTMVILKHFWPYGRDPGHTLFWFIMGLGTVVGGITAYYINSWLVRNKLKHGCMTLPDQEGERGMLHGGMAAGSMEHEPAMDMNMGEGEMAQGGMDHEMGQISTGEAVTIIIGTFLVLFFAIWFTSYFIAPITFSR